MTAAQGAGQSQAAALPVLVTGATGFVGSHLCEALAEQGYAVHTLSRSTPKDGRYNHHVCDITDAATVDAVVQLERWHAIVHLAGLISYTPSDAAAMQAINVNGTRNLLSAAIAHAPNTKLVLCSTVAAVGSNHDANAAPLTEDAGWESALDALAYPRTKRAAEDMVLAAGAARTLRTAALCPSNVFGARDGLKASRKTQMRAANGRCRIFTRGGVSIVHVSVVVRAFLQLLRISGDDEVWYGSRWLLTGDNISIQRMLTLFSEAGGNERYAPWLCLPNWVLASICWFAQRIGSRSMTMDRFILATRYHWFDGSRARKQFDLNEVSARDAIADSVSWMREQGVVKPRS